MTESGAAQSHKQIRYIYWFAYYGTDSPSVRYRAQYPLEYFRRRYQVPYSLIIPGYSPGRVFSFLKTYVSALLFRKPGSLIVIQRVQSHFIYAALLKILVRFQRTGTVYDLDDADYLDNDPSTIYYFAKHCSALAAGSSGIRSHLQHLVRKSIRVPSPVAGTDIVKGSRNGMFTVGWMGSYGGGHRQGLETQLFPALKKLPFPVRLSLIGVHNDADASRIRDIFADAPNVELELPLDIDWKNESGLQRRIVKFDVGIATLTPDLLQISKSGIKAKQYLNNGVPVLSTNLAENNTVVVDGINGYFCDTPDDYEKRICQFQAMSDDEYSRFSIHARKSVSGFDHDHYFHCLLQFIH